MNLKPFNSVKANNNYPVITRCGWDVKIAGVMHNMDDVKEDERVIGWVYHPEINQWVIKSWTLDGKHFAHREGQDRFDLFML